MIWLSCLYEIMYFHKQLQNLSANISMNIVCHNLWHYFIDLELRWFNNRLPWKQLYFMLVGVRGQIQNKLSAKSKRKSYGIFFWFIELCVFISSKFLFLRYYQVIAFHFVKKSHVNLWMLVNLLSTLNTMYSIWK